VREYRPLTQTVRDRIELILIEEINKAQTDHIDLFVSKTTHRLMALFFDEINYNASRQR
jgi:hypothetical protein